MNAERQQVLAKINPVKGREMVSVAQVEQGRAAVLELMQRVMQPDVHYGVIRGCGDKPTLLQPGAQALAQWLDSGVLAQALARQLQAEVPHAA